MADFVEEPETIDFFLWVSHGMNVSDDSAYYYFPYDYKFDYLVMYSKPLKIAYVENLDDFNTNPCDLITGSCPFLPITQESGKKTIYLPPLLFSVGDSEDPLNEYMGLFHYRIIKTGLNSCQIVNGPTHVITYDNIYAKYESKNFTYSSIFKMVKEYIKSFNVGNRPENRINVSDVLLGIYSCQVNTRKYVDKNPVKNKISTLVPRIKDRKNSIVFDTDFADKPYVPFFIEFSVENMHNWTALGGITEQGCGLNILSYYGLMPENEARQEMTCLHKGTSIYKIVQYVADGLKQYETNPNPFLVIRYPLYKRGIGIGISILYNLINALPNEHAIIFKIYKDATYKEEGKISHIGHTTSIYRGSDNFYIIDPQLGVDTENLQQYQFETVEQFAGLMLQTYPDKQWVDIVFYNTNLDGFFKIGDMHEQFGVGEEDFGILTDSDEISYGGRSRGRGKGRSRGRSRGKGRTRKLKRGGKGKGDEKGKIGEILKILKEIDSQNGVKTALVNNSTVIEKPEDIQFSENALFNSLSPKTSPKLLRKTSPKLLRKTSPDKP